MADERVLGPRQFSIANTMWFQALPRGMPPWSGPWSGGVRLFQTESSIQASLAQRARALTSLAQGRRKSEQVEHGRAIAPFCSSVRERSLSSGQRCPSHVKLPF
eukprot:6331073-Alexandrium_andersonii.AAC.1